MIAAEKNPFVEAIFAWLNRRMMRQHFHVHYLRGQNHLNALDPSVPIIFYGNHSNWWDGLLAFHLSRDVFHFDGILMMDVKQMTKYRFFRWIGAFSVDQENKHEAKLSLEYAAKELRARRRVLWIYPQGVMLPNDTRPLVFYHGLTRLVEMLGRVQLIPITHRYEFLSEQRPEAFSSVGRVRLIEAENTFEPKFLTEELEKVVTFVLYALRDDIINQRFDGFVPTVRGANSTNVRYDKFRGKHS